MTFQELLNRSIEKKKTLLCVGLDPDPSFIPKRFKGEVYPLFSFNQWIIKKTASSVCAYKPNTAFYEAAGAQGIEELRMTCEYIKTRHPDIPIIIDAKRGDIGNTNEGYAHFAFDYLKGDAITLQPYMGKDALTAFFSRKEKGCIILCRTSNPGAKELQDLVFEGNHLYEILAKKAVSEWNTEGNCFLVVGATYPEELSQIRTIVGDMTILVPGIGAQGGDLKKTLEAGLTSDKKGLIIAVSRSIIYADNPQKEAEKMRNEINMYRAL